MKFNFLARTFFAPILFSIVAAGAWFSFETVLALEFTQIGQKADRSSGGIGDLFRSLLKQGMGEEEPGEIEGAPATIEDHASALLSPSDLLTPLQISESRPWRAPDYSKQTGALGWGEDTFKVPDALRQRVLFWRDIYGKFTTDQGVIHDSENIDIVYMSVDFGKIMRDQRKSLVQKQRLRERFVNSKKKEIIERLKALQSRKSADGLTGEDLRIWRLFEKINKPNKFRDAANTKRVRFQLGQKDRFLLGIYYSGRYLRDMERIFREAGLPIELTRLPFVESSFNVKARSKVGASGIWQIMPRTARGYLRVKSDVDERNDPLMSTLASARILKANYQMLESWPLAITGYNHGAYGMRGITKKLGTSDISEIVSRYRSRTFGFASENFYACFLAALEVERDAKFFFGDPRWAPESKLSEFKLTKSIPYKNLLTFFDQNKAEAELANPHFTSRVRLGKTLIPKGSLIRIPEASARLAQTFLQGKIMVEAPSIQGVSGP